MATTRIWTVKTNLQYSIEYAKNENKTVAVVTEENGPLVLSDIESVIRYATRDDKTINDDGKIIKKYVTGINCCTDTAFEEMLMTKIKFKKEDKILAWHGYQSFKPGEVTPDEAHEIGVKLAEKLWGDRFQVVVTTHLDQKHLHNHFVVNSVSFLDGYKFCDNNHWYYNVMRKESDALCREYGKSVVLSEKNNAMPHGAYRAMQEGKRTIEDIVREDVDRIIGQSRSMQEFFFQMKTAGYYVRTGGKYVTVIPSGKKGIRIDRRWGNAYSLAAIEERINRNRDHIRENRHKGYQAHGVPRAKYKMTGYQALYVRYLFLLGVIPRRKGKTSRQSHFVMREDILKLDTMIAEMNFLRKNGIETDTALDFETAKRQITYNALEENRNKLRNKIRRSPAEKKEQLKEELEIMNNEMKTLRKELFYCRDIKDRSASMQEKMEKANELMNEKGGMEYGRSERS